MNAPTLSQLKRGLQIAEQIASLEAEMSALFKGGPAMAVVAASKGKPAGRRGGKRRLSPQALANIRAAQKKRWAKFRSGKAGGSSSTGSAKAPAKKKGGLTAAGRKRLAAAMKRRWAAAKAGQAPAPTAKKA